MENQLTEFIEITPDWDSMFEHAERIVRAEIDKDSGQDSVLLMLEYGKRSRMALHELFGDAVEVKRTNK
jgi:hypothetical protein